VYSNQSHCWAPTWQGAWHKRVPIST